ncbi:hypothetical protein LTS12_027708 [Elasticomyces elasticus]|nr:hypothetical protein LTS12_027708 [Elasticomyces elasticus]
MRQQGHRYNVVDTERDVENSKALESQTTMTRNEYLEHAKVLLTKSRGRELPGTFNPLLIADLFHEQCTPWKPLLHQYLESIFGVTCGFVRAVIRYLAQDEVAEGILNNIIDPKMRQCMDGMTQKAEATMMSYQKGYPITYNHYFTETIQNVRVKRMESDLTERLRQFMGKRDVHEIEELNFTKLKKSSLIGTLSIRNEVDMDLYACAEAVDCMFAYYKVAMKLVVDNMATQCVEDMLMKSIPDLFSASIVLEMDADTVEQIARESVENAARRDQLHNMARVLESGQETCRRHVPSHRNGGCLQNDVGLTLILLKLQVTFISYNQSQEFPRLRTGIPKSMMIPI